MALEDTRLPGENAADILTQSNTHMRDMMTTRCQIGTANDKDNGMPVSIALSSPVGQCVTAGGTAAKVVSVSNFADFELQSGIEISVYFANANTANNPTLNVGGTGAIPISVQGQASNVSVGAGCFKTGIYNFKYIDLTVSGTRIQQWLLLNGGIAEQTSDYTKYGDGRIVYGKNVIDNKIDKIVLTTTQYVYLELYKEIIDNWSNLPEGIFAVLVGNSSGAQSSFLVYKNSAIYGKIEEVSIYDNDTGIREFRLYAGNWVEQRITFTETPI